MPLARSVHLLLIMFSALPTWADTPAELASRRTPALIHDAAQEYFHSTEPGLAPPRILRLTRDQLDRTTKALLREYFEKTIKHSVPRDPTQTNYEYADLLRFDTNNIPQTQKYIEQLAKRVEQNPQFIVSCPSATDEACLRAGAREFVLKAFRGDARETDIKKFSDFYVKQARNHGLNAATANLVEVTLNSPRYLFRQETETDLAGTLQPNQRLQTLSYMIADNPPNGVGLDYKKAAELTAPGTATENTVNQLLNSPAGREKIVRFFKAWLEIKEPQDFIISRTNFPEFTDAMAAKMVSDSETLLRDHLRRPNPKLKDLADAGLFLHPAVLASHSGPTDNRPVKRGVFWVRKMLCMQMEPPPPGASNAPYAKVGGTERERIETLTNQKNCIGCHRSINPLGFMADNYDAIGRWRKEENGRPVTSQVELGVLDEGPLSSANPEETVKALAGSLMFKQCFVKQMFRFYMGRDELPSDQPLLKKMFLEFAKSEDGNILGPLSVLMNADRTVQRLTTPQTPAAGVPAAPTATK